MVGKELTILDMKIRGFDYNLISILINNLGRCVIGKYHD